MNANTEKRVLLLLFVAGGTVVCYLACLITSKKFEIYNLSEDTITNLFNKTKEEFGIIRDDIKIKNQKKSVYYISNYRSLNNSKEFIKAFKYKIKVCTEYKNSTTGGASLLGGIAIIVFALFFYRSFFE